MDSSNRAICTQWNVPGAAAAIAVPAILILALLGTVFAGDIADGLVALSS